MDEQNIGEPGLVNSGSEAKEIANLTEGVTIKSISSQDEGSDISFFSKQTVSEVNLWIYLLINKGLQPKEKIEDIGEFLREGEALTSIRSVQERMTQNAGGKGGYTMLGNFYRSTMLYPLLEKLVSDPKDSWGKDLQEWQDEWSKPMDPSKFRMAMKIVFTVLSHSRPERQEDYLARLRGIAITPQEADFLADIFKEVYDKSKNPNEAEKTDRENRKIVEDVRSGDIEIPQDGLFHTTSMENLGSIIKDGILCPEAQALSRDFGEATFSASFHTYNHPPKTFIDLTQDLSQGRDTTRNIGKRVHLASFHPSAHTSEDYLLLPPDSFWLYKDTKDTAASRYIKGYDGSPEDFPDRSIGYALIGLPSTALNFVILDEALKEEYAEVARKFPFYIPAYSYSGGLIFTPQEYDTLRTQN